MSIKPLFVCNDIHIGAVRSAGTTTATATQLRADLLYGYSQLLDLANGCDLLINGDLFDTANVLLVDMFAALKLTAEWLQRNPDSTLTLPPGNHDLSKNSETFSSFDFFANYLRVEFGDRVTVPRALAQIAEGMWVIPHMPNQDLFEMELAKVPPCSYLFLHCNYDSGFAIKSDHSLNLSREMADKLPAETIIIAHEHQGKRDGKVLVVGNQIPSSVADCLGNEKKYAVRVGPAIEYIETWRAEDDFVELEWIELVDCVNTTCRFVRVIGTATAAEGAAVVTAISKFRQATKALVVTNAVKIEGMDTSVMEDLSLEQIQEFDVMRELMAILSPEEQAIVVKLLEKA